MKSSGPWNLRGLRPEARQAAREAARRSGVSVGEWLNSVIRPGEEESREPAWSTDFADAADYRQEPRRKTRQEMPRPSRFDDPNRPRDMERSSREHRDVDDGRTGRIGGPSPEEHRRDRDDRPRQDRNRNREREREAARAREEARERARIHDEIRERDRRQEELRKTTQTREELGEVHARLDRLSHQLERLAQAAPPRPAPRGRHHHSGSANRVMKVRPG